MEQMDSEYLLSDVENSMDTLPGTPLTKCLDTDLDQSSNQCDEAPPANTKYVAGVRRDSRIKPETILSRVGSFVNITNPVSLEEIHEYDWADSDSESPTEKSKESYIVQEILADYLKVKSFKRKYPDLTRRVLDAYERSWLQQEGLVPPGRADLGLTALRTDEVLKLLQSDYPEVHSTLTDLFQRRRFQQAAELQKKQYEAARIERGEARAEAARRRALESAVDFNHRLINERVSTRRCYWDLQTMQIHVPQRIYKLLEPLPHPKGAYPVAVIPGQFVDRFELYTSERLMTLPVSHCLYSQPTRKHREPPPLPASLRFGSVEPRPVFTVDPTTNVNGVVDGVETGSVDREMNAASDNQDTDPCTPSKVTKKEELRDSQLPTADRTPYDAGGHSNTEPRLKAPNKTAASDSVCCAVCKQDAQVYVRCSDCGHTGHPKCLDISDSMLSSVKSYPWSCMECKRCVECLDSGHEDQMMFCDKCDRGYHAFCVGLQRIPDGRWECPLCIADPPKTKRRGRKPRKSVKIPKKSRKAAKVDSESSVSVSGRVAKPKRIPRKRKGLSKSKRSTSSAVVSNVASCSTTSTVPGSSQTSSEVPVKRKRGRPRLIRTESPPPKRRYKPRVSKKLKKDEVGLNNSFTSHSLDQSAEPTPVRECDDKEKVPLTSSPMVVAAETADVCSVSLNAGKTERMTDEEMCSRYPETESTPMEAVKNQAD